jgi:hypothetical protein
MDRRNIETVGVRRTGWAALDRDPQEDKVEFLCPHCGTRGQKNARRERTQYHFTDGFLQDLQGEVTQIPFRGVNQNKAETRTGRQMAPCFLLKFLPLHCLVTVPATEAIAPAMLDEHRPRIAVAIVEPPRTIEAMAHDDNRPAHHYQWMSLRARRATKAQKTSQRYRCQRGLLPHALETRQLHRTSRTTLALTSFL